LFQNSIDKSNN